MASAKAPSTDVRLGGTAQLVGGILSLNRVQRHPVSPLLLGAWTMRHELRLVDALYVELARQLRLPLITTNHRLARATPIADAIG
jgi:predicted nucleic acid-binding protein